MDMRTKLRELKKGAPVVAAIAAAVMSGGCGRQGQTGSGEAPAYAVTTLVSQPSELKRTYSATIRGKQDVEIRPNVSGFITKLYVDEGARVSKGQRLFEIDPVPYEAAVKVAEANANVARAAVGTARLTVDNKRELHRRNIIGDFDLQTAENALASAEAQLAQAEAQLVNARNNLSYTQVKSPSDGVIGQLPFRLGALVSPSMTVPMTTVSDISEMYVYFSMNEKQLLELIREGGTVRNMLASMPEVQLQLIDGTMYEHPGRIETIGGVIDPATGTVSMRATFPNRERLLRSGGAGTVLIPYHIEESIVVPQNATYDIQNKTFIYVLDSANTVSARQIDIYPLDNGKDYIVTGGVQAGDRIVTEGVATLKNGMTIKPEER